MKSHKEMKCFKEIHKETAKQEIIMMGSLL